jgi:flagellar biosynthetic protein FlhB
MADTTDDKTLDPTPRRRQQAREAGRVAQSQDLTSAILLLGSLALLMLAGGALVEFLAGFLRDSLVGSSWRSWIHTDDAGRGMVTGQVRELVPALGRLLLPVLAGAVLLVIGGSLLQRGLPFRPHRIAPDLSRVNPLAGMQRVFSGASAARVLFGVMKIGIVGAIALAALWNSREELASLAALGPADLAVQAWDVCFWTCLKIGGALLALSAVDYLYQRWRLECELKMTPRELREEIRELQGDPQIAARRRERRRVGGVRAGSDPAARS